VTASNEFGTTPAIACSGMSSGRAANGPPEDGTLDMSMDYTQVIAIHSIEV
jgi:hypothetical protein